MRNVALIAFGLVLTLGLIGCILAVKSNGATDQPLYVQASPCPKLTNPCDRVNCYRPRTKEIA